MNTRKLTTGGLLAALYVVLTYAQNLLWPGSTTMAIQMRLSEALCIFAFFTPAAIPGLTLGCLRAHAEACLRIPMRPTLRSLNLSNSVAITVYEALRQLEFPGMQSYGSMLNQ